MVLASAASFHLLRPDPAACFRTLLQPSCSMLLPRCTLLNWIGHFCPGPHKLRKNSSTAKRSGQAKEENQCRIVRTEGVAHVCSESGATCPRQQYPSLGHRVRQKHNTHIAQAVKERPQSRIAFGGGRQCYGYTGRTYYVQHGGLGVYRSWLQGGPCTRDGPSCIPRRAALSKELELAQDGPP